MNTLDHGYDAHLAIRKWSILPGKEWLPKPSDWLLIWVNEGTGYWLQGQSSIDLEAGTILLIARDNEGCIRASQLNSLSLSSFSVTPARLTGLITLSEQDFLKQAASQNELAFQAFSPASAIAGKMKDLLASHNPNTLSARLSLLQLFADIFGEKLTQTVPVQENSDARERLRAYLMTASADLLAEMSFEELARTTRCTPRHLSRIFFDLMGMSFSDKRAEIRLARAKELLATSNSKVVEVAFESGYKSLSLFNQMFTRRFGISPGKWRQKNGVNRVNNRRRIGSLMPRFSKDSPWQSGRSANV